MNNIATYRTRGLKRARGAGFTFIHTAQTGIKINNIKKWFFALFAKVVCGLIVYAKHHDTLTRTVFDIILKYTF